MIEVVYKDITGLDVDAIVNAANSSLAGGGGVDGAIHRKAGPALAEAATRHAPLPTGQAVLTPGFGLVARFVIHTVGPVWHGGEQGEPELLRTCYRNCLQIAAEDDRMRSIAFPGISTGVYRFPRTLAAEIAVAEMTRWTDRLERIVACVFDVESLDLYQNLLDPSHD